MFMPQTKKHQRNKILGSMVGQIILRRDFNSVIKDHLGHSKTWPGPTPIVKTEIHESQEDLDLADI